MNPLNSITGTIVAGFVLALVLGLAVKAVQKSSSSKTPASKTVQPK